jgi:hypothetical protein
MTIKYHYEGLTKVISGGQTGVDSGGIGAAHMMGVATGGTVPKGWKTDRGPNPLLECFGMTEHHSTDYGPRTEQNVKNSDATLIIVLDLTTPGTRLTMRLCRDHQKPHFILHLTLDMIDKGFDEHLETKADEVVAFLKEHQVRVLNVAGHRDSRHSTEMFQLSCGFVSLVLQALDADNLLVRDTDL